MTRGCVHRAEVDYEYEVYFVTTYNISGDKIEEFIVDTLGDVVRLMQEYKAAESRFKTSWKPSQK